MALPKQLSATRILLKAILFASLSSSALAEWTQVGDSASAVFYIDRDTATKTRNVVKMRTLTDLKAEERRNNGPSFLSVLRLSEFNCKNKMTHLISMTIYSGNMATGEKIHTDTEPDIHWKPVGQDSYASPFWKAACDQH